VDSLIAAEMKLTIIVVANVDEAEPGTIAHGVAGLYHPDLVPLPE
jgi:hypothetical protein